MTSPTQEPRGHNSRRPLTRRTLMASVGLTGGRRPGRPHCSPKPTAAGRDAGDHHASPAGPRKGPVIPKSGYLVEEIAERTYWLTDGLYQMIFLVTPQGGCRGRRPAHHREQHPGRALDRERDQGAGQPTPSTATTHADHTGAMALYEGRPLVRPARGCRPAAADRRS